jgi:hypothetical protein
VPLSTTQAERIAEIRDWASKRAVPASVPEEGDAPRSAVSQP